MKIGNVRIEELNCRLLATEREPEMTSPSPICNQQHPQSEIAGLIKPTVLSLSAYTLSGLSAGRKLNQNEIAVRCSRAPQAGGNRARAGTPWNRYPEFVPRKLVEQIAAKHDWDPEECWLGTGPTR